MPTAPPASDGGEGGIDRLAGEEAVLIGALGDGGQGRGGERVTEEPGAAVAPDGLVELLGLAVDGGELGVVGEAVEDLWEGVGWR